jgi:glycosyltransferase involved in cell wall biosynthesis
MLDILYVAFNRLEYTKVTWNLMLENTNWDLVNGLVVYDDGSSDGTQEWLLEQCDQWDWSFPVTKRDTNNILPVNIMNHYIERADSDWFVKLDNDIAVPPGWLDEMLGVVERQKDIELLGMQAGTVGIPGSAGGPGSSWEGPHGFEEASHIGGVGLMKTEAFRNRQKIYAHGRFGFTEWQSRHNLVRGWICPDLLVPQLDRVPIEPYTSLSAEYIAQGWQRPWPQMDARWSAPYYDWLPEEIPV